MHVTPFSIHSAKTKQNKTNIKSLEKLSSVNQNPLWILGKKLAVRQDVTPSSSLQHLLRWSLSATPSPSGSSIYHCLPSCLSVHLWVSLLNGVWRKTGNLGGASNEEWCGTVGAVQSPGSRLTKSEEEGGGGGYGNWSVGWSVGWVSGLIQWPCSVAGAGSSI